MAVELLSGELGPRLALELQIIENFRNMIQ